MENEAPPSSDANGSGGSVGIVPSQDEGHGDGSPDEPDLAGYTALAGSDTGPELVIGLVGAMGTPLDLVETALQTELGKFAYKSTVIRLSRELCSIKGYGPYPENQPTDLKYLALMTKGTQFRKRFGEDSLARLGIIAIRRERQRLTTDRMRPADRFAFIVHSLKHPKEVEAFRRTYGRRFILIAAYAPREQRVSDIAKLIAESLNTARIADQRSKAERLVLRDEFERDEVQEHPVAHGQKVGDVFPMADAFVNTSNRPQLEKSITRITELLFGYNHHTPSRDEQGMYFAGAAALRSSSLARQVGAALVSSEGDIIATGVNEVPKTGGGEYWEGDVPDDRDYTWGKDVSDSYRNQLVSDALRLLQKSGWLDPSLKEIPVPELVTRALADGLGDEAPGPLSQARLMDVMEYVRAVHAEMSALAGAARNGLSSAKHSLYVTTFPCHECARLIVASGIARVVYIEPYPKSLAAQLYPSAIEVETETAHSAKVQFQPFIGIAPRRYADWFIAREKRKDKRSGKIIITAPDKTRPRVPGPYSVHVFGEVFETASLETQLLNEGLR